jgi:hypothetical protein
VPPPDARCIVLIPLSMYGSLGEQSSYAVKGNPFNMCPDLAKLSSHLRTYPYLAWR